MSMIRLTSSEGDSFYLNADLVVYVGESWQTTGAVIETANGAEYAPKETVGQVIQLLGRV